MKETLHKGQLSDNGLNESQQENRFYVYALVCPIDNIIRYIGATIDPDTRFKQHLKDKTDCEKSNWIKSLCELNKKPIFEILSSHVNVNDCTVSELEYCKKYKDQIFNYKHPRPYKFNGDLDALKCHISFPPEDYKKIQDEAKKLGMPVSIYCKMLVLKSLTID